MTRLPQARFDEALAYWQFSAAWWGGAVPVRCATWPAGKTWWHRGPRGRLAANVRWLDERKDEEIRVGLPWERPSSGGVSRASLLWCVVEGPDQLKRAQVFKPRPAIVFAIGSGSRRLLFWPLEEVLSWAAVKDANRRIAYRLRAVQKYGDPDVLWFPAPGTCAREGRARPVPVRVSRLTVDTFVAGQVVGGLKAPPENAFMASIRGGSGG